jgi:hypothetical protein
MLFEHINGNHGRSEIIIRPELVIRASAP